MSAAFRAFVNSETGPRTVHFWAPVLKWSLVFAGISDIQRPVDTLSGTQQIALFATGCIWTRWCMIIKPKNVLLASVNFFLGGVAGYQLSRIVKYRIDQGDNYSQAVSYIFNGEDGLPKKVPESKPVTEKTD